MSNDRKNDRRKNLKELSDSDYQIAENQPDINDWKILDQSGKKVGKVKDLLFDEESRRVRYIITNLKKGEFLDDDRDVLIPIGQAQLDKDNDRVIVPNVTRDKLVALPKFSKTEDLTHEDETKIRNSFAGTSATYERENFYEHEDFDEEKFYDASDKNRNRNTNNEGKVDVVEENMEVGKREVETGGTRISSRIVERPAEEKVNLKEEHVNVNRKAVDRPADSSDMKNYKDRTIEEHETAEVPVVNKEARVVEEVSLDKETETREEVVKDSVRETKVDVDQLEGDRNRKKDVSARDPRNRDGDVPKSDRVKNSERTREEDKNFKK